MMNHIREASGRGDFKTAKVAEVGEISLGGKERSKHAK